MSIIDVLEGINQYGAIPLSLVMIFLVGALMNQIKKNRDDDHARHKSLQEQVKSGIEGLKDALEKRIDDHERRIKVIEMDYVQKEDFFRENAGWRAEIQNLQTKIDKVFAEIIALWKDGNGTKK
jgi:hypothetical protein